MPAEDDRGELGDVLSRVVTRPRDVRMALNGRIDLLTIAVDELVEELYTQLHWSADGGPHATRQQRKP